MSKAILYDATLCIGCKQCEVACADQNKLPYNDAIAAEERQSEHKFTVVLTKDDKFMRRLCMHCERPACASACPVGAFHKTAAASRPKLRTERIGVEPDGAWLPHRQFCNRRKVIFTPPPNQHSCAPNHCGKTPSTANL